MLSLSVSGLDKTKPTNLKGMYGGWLVQGDVVMLAMFDTMFEMSKHA